MKKFITQILPKKYLAGIKENITTLKSIGKTKVFCIGLNKTGTTSLKEAMKELGFIVGHQRTAERLMHDWVKRDFKKILKHCKTAQFFQDAPFSKPYTFVVLDHAFPESKFILTIRDSAEQWYESLTRFHANKWGENNRIPTKQDLQKASYIRRGWAWEMNRLTYDTPEDEPYKKDILLNFYATHNHSVNHYFRHRTEDLLVLNVAEKGAYQKLCHFLDVESDRQEFPWVNKTKKVNNA